MKHLLSFVASLAATASLLLTLSSTVQADHDVVTTIPDPSGAVSCYGKNTDGSPAAWTVGGEIRYTSDYSDPPAHLSPGGYHNTKMTLGGGCQYQVATSSNIKPGCATITGSMDIYYTPYSGAPTSEPVDSYTIPAPTADGLYTKSSPVPFGDIDDAINTQYKVTSSQNGVELGKAATTNL